MKTAAVPLLSHPCPDAQGYGAFVARSLRSGMVAAGVFVALVAHPAETTLRRVEPREVDSLFAAWDKPGSPGAALAVIHDGRIVYERGYGTADLERNIPITPETRFYVGSVSKQFAAAAIALLEQEGKLSLDDPAQRYVPELPDFAAAITIRQMVHHTSGLRDYLSLRDIAGAPQDGSFNDAEILALLGRQKALNFEPGARQVYSNSGYFLLSLIVKRTSGKSLREFAAEKIFAPLAMSSAQFRDDHRAPIAHQAQGYSTRPGGGYRVNNPNFDVVGAGGVFMTVRDFLAWDRNFYDARVGGLGFVEQLQTPGRLNDGTALNYAFGLRLGTYRGLPIVEHGGSYGGFMAHVIRFAGQRFSVVCFSNLGSMAPGQLARHVADLYLAGALQSPATAESRAPAAEGGSATAVAAREANGWPVARDELREFAAEYFSDEVEAMYRVSFDGAALTLHGGRRGTTALRPTQPDTFSAGTWTLRFQRETGGAIASFTLSSERARGVVFARR